MDTREELKQVQAKLAMLDPNNRDHLVDIAALKTREAELVKQAAVEEAVEKKDAEIQELVLGHNFNEIFGDPEANKLIHGVMMNLVEKYEKNVAELYREIAEKENAVVDANAKVDELTGAGDRLKDLESVIEEKDTEITELKTRLEEEMKESRHYRNECARHEMDVRKLRAENDQLRRDRSISKDQNTDEVVQRIMERTKRKQLKDVKKNTDGSLTGTDAEGREVTVPWYAAKSIEAVDTFPEASQASAEVGHTGNSTLVAEPTFQIPQNDVSGVPGVQSETDGNNHIGSGKDVDQAGAQSLEERLAALEEWKKHVDEVIGTDEKVAV